MRVGRQTKTDRQMRKRGQTNREKKTHRQEQRKQTFKLPVVRGTCRATWCLTLEIFTPNQPQTSLLIITPTDGSTGTPINQFLIHVNVFTCALRGYQWDIARRLSFLHFSQIQDCCNFSVLNFPECLGKKAEGYGKQEESEFALIFLFIHLLFFFQLCLPGFVKTKFNMV